MTIQHLIAPSGLLTHCANDESSSLNSREDTAKKEDDNNKFFEVVDRFQKVVREGRERHVKTWEYFYLKIVPKHPHKKMSVEEGQVEKNDELENSDEELENLPRLRRSFLLVLANNH